MASLLDPSTSFPALLDSVGLDYRLKKAVSRLGYSHPTLVQSKCLPLAISEGRDLLVRARTGSGKTLAYCLPVLHKLLQQGPQQTSFSEEGDKGFLRCVVLVPTRELCMQVHETIRSLIYYCHEELSVVPLAASPGGSKKNKARKHEDTTRQEAMLRDRPSIVVATPAGLLTHITNGTITNLKTSIEMVVVDEADLVLSFGYAKDVSEIMKSFPRIYQGFLMSATLSPEVDSLKKVVLHSPVILKLEQDDDDDIDENAGGDKNNRSLKQFYLGVPKKDKNLVLYVFLKLGLLKGKGLFFVNSTDAGYRLKLFLEQFSIRSAVLNAELPFRSRWNIMEQFNVGNFDYLIATDDYGGNNNDRGGDDDDDDDNDNDDDETKRKKKKKSKNKRQKDTEYGVARGMDFRNVSFVVNFDFPVSTHSYSHRVGRTARGGKTGVAFSLVELESEDQNDMLSRVRDDQPLLSSSSNNSNNSMLGDHHSAAKMDEDDDEAMPQQQQQPTPLDFNLNEIEGFRYRVEDVTRAVTRSAVRETRAAELKAEILNSERLQSNHGYFEDNPNDLQLLRHDRQSTHVSKVQEHLKHVPKYLLPRGMEVANLNRKRKRKKARKYQNKRGPYYQKREDNDPLRSYNDGGDGTNDDGGDFLDGVVDGSGNDGGGENYDEFGDIQNGGDDDDNGARKKRKQEERPTDKFFANTRDGLGKSTSGRQAWKERHKKGKFSGKQFRKSEYKKRRAEPLGI